MWSHWSTDKLKSRQQLPKSAVWQVWQSEVPVRTTSPNLESVRLTKYGAQSSTMDIRTDWGVDSVETNSKRHRWSAMRMVWTHCAEHSDETGVDVEDWLTSAAVRRTDIHLSSALCSHKICNCAFHVVSNVGLGVARCARSMVYRWPLCRQTVRYGSAI